MQQKLFCLVLFIFSITATSIAQNEEEMIFNYPAPGKLPAKFEYILGKGNKMTFELSFISQIDSFPDLEKLVKKVLADLEHFSDSLEDELSSKRIDYIIGANDRKIKISRHNQQTSVFSISNNDQIYQLKTAQDTLRIRLTTSGDKKGSYRYAYFITFTLNNLSDLQALLEKDIFRDAVSMLKKDIHPWKHKKRYGTKYYRSYALYDLTEEKRMAPVPARAGLSNARHTMKLPPYIQAGVQYVRGAWVSSVGVGPNIKKQQPGGETQHFLLMWEPHFFFEKNVSGKTTMARNDFITFRYSHNWEYSGQSIRLLTTASIGYLIRRKGEWLEKGTVKFSLAGAQMKKVLLEPEFMFNKFFRNFSPSLKLTVYID